jgi:hypothetical protein
MRLYNATLARSPAVKKPHAGLLLVSRQDEAMARAEELQSILDELAGQSTRPVPS